MGMQGEAEKVVRDVTRELRDTMAVLETTSAVAGPDGTGKGIRIGSGDEVGVYSSKGPDIEGVEGNNNDTAMKALEMGVKGLDI